jgi:hypothetical protein
MNTQGIPTPSSAEDACESVFLGCTVLGTFAGVLAAAVGSAELLGGAYVEAVAVAGAAVGGATFGALGAFVLGPAWAALLAHRHAPASEVAEHPPAAVPVAD